ncbi:hypothetical protein CSUI_008943, partial [Cystoisospora suis]
MSLYIFLSVYVCMDGALTCMNERERKRYTVLSFYGSVRCMLTDMTRYHLLLKM